MAHENEPFIFSVKVCPRVRAGQTINHFPLQSATDRRLVDRDQTVILKMLAYKALGMKFLRDQEVLRSGEKWNPALLS
jgi:hypothetical protein